MIEKVEDPQLRATLGYMAGMMKAQEVKAGLEANLDFMEKHLNACFRAKTPDMVAVGALYSAMRCVQEILKVEMK